MDEARLRRHYRENVVPTLRERFGYDNPHQIPRVEKVVLNVGVGEAADDHRLLESVVEEVAAIAGQKPIVTRARKSISSFNVRRGQPVGVKATLRKRRMYEFLDRLVSVAIPRIRDFRGLPQRSFDGRGNYTVGIKEQIIFPEVDIEEVREVHGMDITVVTTTDRDDEAFTLLRELGFPFRGEVPVAIGAAID